MLINHDRRFIFYHVPKVAGSSIRAALKSLPGSWRLPGTGKHTTPAEFAWTWRGLIDWRLRGYFTFCFVRDPWERFGSLHSFLLRHRLRREALRKHVPGDLNDFGAALANRSPWIMELRSIRPQSEYARAVRFVGRYERLHQDFASVVERLSLPDMTLGHMNASGEPDHHRERMSARTEAIIADFYREDIERFGYR